MVFSALAAVTRVVSVIIKIEHVTKNFFMLASRMLILLLAGLRRVRVEMGLESVGLDRFDQSLNLSWSL